jgi:hypothetical protein
LLGFLGIAGIIGCRDNTPPPPRVPVPVPESDRRAAMREYEEMKPLPPPRADEGPRPPFYDEPLVSQRPPEQRAFVDAYTRVGRPRITLFVNRSLEGKIIPVNPADPLVSVEHNRTRSRGGNPRDERRDTLDVYLRPGQYDEVSAKSIDYEAIENIMLDWMGANGQVTLISPTLARQRLSDQTVKEMQQGRPQVLSEVAQQLGADVLIQVQARPTKQTPEGLQVRIIAEAMNTRGGQSLGRAVVDVPPPLDKPQMNEYTRFLARKLMDQMTETWSAPPPAEMRRDDNDRAPARSEPPAPSAPLAPAAPSAPDASSALPSTLPN